MELEINAPYNQNPAELYKTRWLAHYKKGLGSPTVVYGRTMNEAMCNALAEFRKNNDILSDWPIDKIVDGVEMIA